MTRITEMHLSRSLIGQVMENRDQVNRYSQEISTGYKVTQPGDSNVSGTIAQYRETLARIQGYKQRISMVIGGLNFQEDALSQANEVLARAKEVASQAANETNTPENRLQMANEVFQLRDHLVGLANSKYQGKYIYGGADDDDPPYDQNTYVSPATGAASQRYVFDAEDGTDVQRTVNITESLSIETNTPGNQIFDNAIQALERLGRALAGYETLPVSGAPDGTGDAYTFPDDNAAQTAAIQDAISLIDTARTEDIMPERVDVGARLRRLDAAESLLELTHNSTEEMLGKLQNADLTESASHLSLAQTALEASLAVTARVLDQSILNFI